MGDLTPLSRDVFMRIMQNSYIVQKLEEVRNETELDVFDQIRLIVSGHTIKKDGCDLYGDLKDDIRKIYSMG